MHMGSGAHARGVTKMYSVTESLNRLSVLVTPPSIVRPPPGSSAHFLLPLTPFAAPGDSMLHDARSAASPGPAPTVGHRLSGFLWGVRAFGLPARAIARTQSCERSVWHPEPCGSGSASVGAHIRSLNCSLWNTCMRPPALQSLACKHVNDVGHPETVARARVV